LDPVLRRRRWTIRRRLEGWKIRDIADALRIDEKTVDRWWSVYRKERWEDVLLDGLTERILELCAGKYRG
jgi:transposase